MHNEIKPLMKKALIQNNVALKSDSIHHFFKNACTKSGSLQFSQLAGC
jgi:hypothetical protein